MAEPSTHRGGLTDEQIELFEGLRDLFLSERERLQTERNKFWDLWLHEKFLRIKAEKETRA